MVVAASSGTVLKSIRTAREVWKGKTRGGRRSATSHESVTTGTPDIRPWLSVCLRLQGLRAAS